MTFASIEDALNEIRLLRTAVLPAYAEDDDEDTRSDEEYIRFFSDNVNEAIRAAAKYCDAFQYLVEHLDEGEAFTAFLDARKQFVRTFPFAHDDWEKALDPESAAFLWRQFKNGRIDLWSVDQARRYHETLVALREFIRG